MNQRQGKVKSSQCIEPIIEKKYDDLMADKVDEDEISTRGVFATSARMMLDMTVSGMYMTYTNLEKDQVGQHINPELSFLKLPVAKSKVGGGVRVKRVLLFDKGIEDSDEVVIGTTYRYEMEDGSSSGIASNEPASAREENSLVDFIPVKGQKWWDKLIAGEILQQTEGPLGESILPAPSVGHRRVVVENIHTGNSGNGYAVHDFYTTYDYPFDKTYNPLDNDRIRNFTGSANERTDLEEDTDQFRVNLGLVAFNVEKSWASQGFRFIQTNMNGQKKRTSTYGGTYNLESVAPISSFEEYEYYEPGEKVRVMGMDESGNLLSEDKMLGMDMDVVRGSKKIEDINIDFNVEFDIGIAFTPLQIGFSIPPWPSFSYSENTLATDVITKVISYPAIVKKVTRMVDGIVSESENMAFNEQTGDPIIVRTADSFERVPVADGIQREGDIYNFSIPASWVYQEMGPKSLDESNTNQLTAMTANFAVYETEPDVDWFNNPVNLLKASIQTFVNNWGQKTLGNHKMSGMYPDSDGSIDAIDEIWRPDRFYTYKADALSNTNGKVYEKGYFDIGSANRFLWREDNQSDNWLKMSEITLYSPDGEGIEEKDVLEIPSTAIYGSQYRGNVPVMVAKNADNNSVIFNDFERGDVSPGQMPAHSGSASSLLSDLTNLLGEVYCSQILKTQGGLLKVWVDFDEQPEHDLRFILAEGTSEGTNSLPMKKIARAQDWILYEVELSPDLFASIPINAPLSGQVCGANEEGLDGVYIDDLRFQPLKASSNCFVYDINNLRLLAQFDDQHFGTYFQYDQEGKLTRKILETERGNYTLQEMNYNTYKETRAN